MSVITIVRRCAACAVLAMLVSGAHAASTRSGGSDAKPDQRPPSRVTFIDAPSSESAAAREKRLKRECKGRPNAGACLGHTR